MTENQLLFNTYPVVEYSSAIREYSDYFSTLQDTQVVYISLLFASLVAPTIVVLGITYPATIDFLEQLLSRYTQANVVFASIPIENYISTDQIGSGNLMSTTFQLVLQQLEMRDLRADILCIPANTNHVKSSFSILSSTVSDLSPETKIVHMPEEVSFLAKKQGYKRLGVLGTMTTTSPESPYTASLQDQDLIAVYPSTPDRQILHSLIMKLIQSTDEMTSDNAHILQDVMSRMGVDAFVLGCTEFPMLLRMTGNLNRTEGQQIEKVTGKQLLDSTMTLVDAVIRESNKV